MFCAPAPVKTTDPIVLSEQQLRAFLDGRPLKYNGDTLHISFGVLQNGAGHSHFSAERMERAPWVIAPEMIYVCLTCDVQVRNIEISPRWPQGTGPVQYYWLREAPQSRLDRGRVRFVPDPHRLPDFVPDEFRDSMAEFTVWFGFADDPNPTYMSHWATDEEIVPLLALAGDWTKHFGGSLNVHGHVSGLIKATFFASGKAEVHYS